MNDKVYVWDRFVRLFHWSLVFAFTVSYLTGDEITTVHVYSGYFILGILILRVGWGFVGSKHARFSDFLRPVPEAIGYLRRLVRGDSPRFVGHNPAGGWMVIALMVSILCTGFSGLKVYGLEGHGPLAVTANVATDRAPVVVEAHAYEHNDDDEHGEYDEDRDYREEADDQHEATEEFWEEIHEVCAHLAVLLVLLHIGGVVLSSLRHGENLVKAMISGYKKRE